MNRVVLPLHEKHHSARKLLQSAELEYQLRSFVHYYNHARYHEVLQNFTHADVYYGRDLRSARLARVY